jgi:hypothetical protein
MRPCRRVSSRAPFGPMEVLKGWKQGEVIKSTTDCKSVGYTTAMYRGHE